MEQEKKNKIGKIIIITIIAIAALILSIFIIEIIILKQDGKQDNLNITQEPPISNQVQNQVSNTQNNTVVNNNITTPILNETSGGQINYTTTELISNTYYYNQLNVNSKIIYDNLKQNKEHFYEGTYKFDFGTQFNTLLHTQNGEKELNEAFQSAWNALSYDDVELFYVDINKITLLNEFTTIGGITTYSVSIGPGSNYNYLKPEFQGQEQIKDAQNYMQNIVNQIVEQTKLDSPEKKAKRIHDWLVATVEYDTNSNSNNKFHIYGALHDQKAVCEGYARAYKYLMEQVGVPCVLVSGTATNSQGQTEAHAWNYVQINNKWYAVDVTWDDPVIEGGGQLSNDAKYRYFLKGSDSFKKDHKEDGVVSENSMKFSYPRLETSDYMQ